MIDKAAHHTTHNPNFAARDAAQALAVRLLIARASNPDSLAWWEDESLTRQGGFLIERIFPVAPPLAARNLALHAAFARHRAACPAAALHLYRLDADNQDGLAMRQISLLKVAAPPGAMTTLDMLRDALLSLTGRPMRYRVVRQTQGRGLEIEIPPAPAETAPILHRAHTLAWAYLEGAPRAPVFPYCFE